MLKDTTRIQSTKPRTNVWHGGKKEGAVKKRHRTYESNAMYVLFGFWFKQANLKLKWTEENWTWTGYHMILRNK